VNSSKEAYEILRGSWDSNNIELFETFKLLVPNRAHRVLGVLNVSQEGISGTVADPKIIFATALKCAASGIIVAHNHPSGNLKPLKRTKTLQKGSRTGVISRRFNSDHLICTTESYSSFADEGMC
jgi:DNA repair protein RadC